MDCFIKITDQKKIDNKTTIHTTQLKAFEACLREGKNVFVCGSTGVGKTHFVSVLLNHENSIEIENEHVSSKSAFLGVIRGSNKHLVIENYEHSQYPFKTLIDRVCDGYRVTNGSLVVISNELCMGYPNFETIMIPHPTIDQLLTIECDPNAEAAAKMCRGDIRTFKNMLHKYDDRDVFKTPKEFISDILCSGEPVGFQESLTEHGNIWNIFQENYLNLKDVEIQRSSYSFSDADIYDTFIYEGN